MLMTGQVATNHAIDDGIGYINITNDFTMQMQATVLGNNLPLNTPLNMQCTLEVDIASNTGLLANEAVIFLGR